jgi:hypothetical protein
MSSFLAVSLMSGSGVSSSAGCQPIRADDKANYLSDLWIFDTNELKWKQIEYLDKDRAPG